MSDAPIFRHSVDVQVRFTDVDRLGHVTNNIYLTFYDTGKMVYVRDVVGSWVWEDGAAVLAFVGASMRLDFYKPIFYTSQIKVETRIAKIGNKSLLFAHRIINKENGDIMSTGEAVMVCYSPKLNVSIPVPDDWRKQIAQYEPSYVPGSDVKASE